MAKKRKKPAPVIASLLNLFGSVLLLGGIAVAATEVVFQDPIQRAGVLLAGVCGALFYFGMAALIGYANDASDQAAMLTKRRENYQKMMLSLMKAIEGRVTTEALVVPSPSLPSGTEGEKKTSLEHYYHDGISRHGPFPKQDMQELIDSGEIGPDTLVYIEGWEKWRPLKEAPTGSFSR